MSCGAARLRRHTAIVASVVVLLGLASPIVAAAADDTWSGTVTLATSRAEVDVHNTTALLTAEVGPNLAGPYVLSIYNDSGVRVLACGDQFSACETNNTGHVTINVANNATRTYTAYVAQTAPGGGPPVDDVRAASNTVTVRNTGWEGTVSLASSRTVVDVHDTTAVLTAVVDSSLAGPYVLSIYNDQGDRPPGFGPAGVRVGPAGWSPRRP